MIFGTLAILSVLAPPVHAGGKGELQAYFSGVAAQVKATDNPIEKRMVLSESFRSMSKALDMVRSSTVMSANDAIGIDHFAVALQEKQDELAGNNGYARVPDVQLNAFSDYVVQDTEQADQVITISVVTLLLIVILIVLMVK
jgi:hypothetical protein